MRLSFACSLVAAAALPAVVPTAQAASVPPIATHAKSIKVEAGAKRNRPKDCTPYNGPFGFYGNIWCQPPIVSSYMRNLGSSWPQKTPPSLRKPKPSSDYEW
jgi:hypothetical protein